MTNVIFTQDAVMQEIFTKKEFVTVVPVGGNFKPKQTVTVVYRAKNSFRKDYYSKTYVIYDVVKYEPNPLLEVLALQEADGSISVSAVVSIPMDIDSTEGMTIYEYQLLIAKTDFHKHCFCGERINDVDSTNVESSKK